VYVCLPEQSLAMHVAWPHCRSESARAQDAAAGRAGLDRLKRSLQELHGAEEAALDTHARLVDQTATMRSTLSKVRVWSAGARPIAHTHGRATRSCAKRTATWASPTPFSIA
jgi:hypothetical protein